jgi:hypothetical protein
MRNRETYHYRRSSNGLLNFLGFIFALILVVGLLDKAGVKINLGGDRESGVDRSAFLESSLRDKSNTDDNVIVIEPDGPSSRDSRDYSMPKEYESSSSSRQASSRQSLSVEDWINKFASAAVAEAVSRGVPAGISLAVGVSKIKSGERITDWNSFMNEVIEPLAGIKYGASYEDLRAYFKYSANSDLWVKGLGRTAGYSESALRKIINQYDLSNYDSQVRMKVSGGTNPEVERKANYVADEVVTSMRNLKNETPRYESGAERTESARRWENRYDEVVGREVAKEIAKKKINGREYISEDEMSSLVQETNVETGQALEKKLAFPGRSINKNHPDAARSLDITDPKNSQARYELYLKKLKENN